MKKTIAMSVLALAVSFGSTSCKKKADTAPAVEAPVAETPTAPIETTNAVDIAVQQKVKDALKDFPSVKVDVVDGTLTLTGNVSSTQARKIKESVDALKVGKVNFNYTVK